ncbi:hypothetical protein DPEC_G00220820 [Dallia pectoralis]|uniref:Uncharacterized protein n=1 Tax=Dallia pectoralis TaxID=75939 RepID=A0ACC2G3W3_DALPE|nr:hypothetical protein DPEC_G00220820 [Dallia pectoralis]
MLFLVAHGALPAWSVGFGVAPGFAAAPFSYILLLRPRLGGTVILRLKRLSHGPSSHQRLTRPPELSVSGCITGITDQTLSMHINQILPRK